METRGLVDRSQGGRVSTAGQVLRQPRAWRARLGLALLWLGMFGLLALAIRQAPLGQIGRTLAHLGAWQVAVLAVLNFTILLLLTARWSILVRALGTKVSWWALLAYRLAGFGVSYFTPGPQFGGEPLQVHLLHRRQGMPLPGAIASVFLDRLVDLLANFLFLGLGVVTILAGGWFGGQARPLLWLVPWLLLLPAVHLAALWQGKRPVTWLVTRLGQLLRRPAVQAAALVTRRAEEQIGQLCRERPAVLLRVMALSGLTWGLMILEFWLMLRLLGVEAGLAQAIRVLTAARLAFLLPFPGGLGALEAGQALAAHLTGWEPAVGVAISLVIRARDVLLAGLGVWLGSFVYRKTWFRKSAA